MLGLDAVILGFLYKSYESCSSYIEALKDAEQCDISQLKDLATPKTSRRSWFWFWRSSAPTSSGSEPTPSNCRYVVIRGKVEPLDRNRILHSVDERSSGVIHRITTKEVVAHRSGSRFWIDENRLIKSVQHEVPWKLKGQDGDLAVQIVDGLSADRIDMPVIRDQFTPVPFSLSTWLGGFVAGHQVKGSQEIEEMLIDGSLLTAVGELVVAGDGSIHLRSPQVNCGDRQLPYILSTLPYSALLNTYETLISVCKWSLVFFGGVGVILCYLLVRRWLRVRYGRRNARDEDEILRELQLSRRDAPPDGLADHLLCVVCLDQTREVIVMPCGHVCLCADCMIQINQRSPYERNCPMCRRAIDQIARAFVP